MSYLGSNRLQRQYCLYKIKDVANANINLPTLYKVVQKSPDINGNFECHVAVAPPHVLQSKFEVPTAMLVEIPNFCDTASCKLFYGHQN